MSKLLTKLYSEPEICPANPGPADMRFDNGKNKPWLIQFRYYNTATGKWELQIFKKGINYLKNYRDRLKAASALRDNIRDQLERGWNPITNTMPLDQALDPMENEVASLPFLQALKYALGDCKVSPGSLKEYRLTLSRIAGVAKSVRSPARDGGECYLDFTGIEIGRIKKFHIKLVLDQCERKYSWTEKSWNKHLGNLQALFSRLVDADVYEHNPAHDIKYRDVSESDKYKPLTEADKKKIREEIFLHHFGFFVYLMALYHTGMRPFELLALKLSDINMEGKYILIRPDPKRQNSKTRPIRMIPVNDHLLVLLQNWVVGYDDKDLYLFGSPFTSGLGNRGKGTGGAMSTDYFRPSSTRIKRDTVTRLWNSLVRVKFGIDKYMYALKHTGGDDKILAGVDLDALRDMYGHQNKRMTERYVKRLKEVYSNEIRKKSPAF